MNSKRWSPQIYAQTTGYILFIECHVKWHQKVVLLAPSTYVSMKSYIYFIYTYILYVNNLKEKMLIFMFILIFKKSFVLFISYKK